MKIAKKISASETLTILDNQWLTTKELQAVACCGSARASEIRKTIETELLEKEGKRLPSGLTPTDKVVQYLGINISYLKKIAKD